MKVSPLLSIRVHIAEPFAAAEQVGAQAGIFALEVEGQVTHLSATGNLGRRASRIARAVPESAREVLIHCWPTGTKLQTSLLLYELARQYFPDTYLQRLHLRIPWFVALLAKDQFPRLTVTNRFLAGSSPVIGPFPNKEAAQLYEERVQSAFLLRRCTDTLQPSLEHPGCLYGEIKQCLRPCQAAVSVPEYGAEAATVASFLRDGGRKTIPALIAIRDKAAEATDFETAAKLHKQVEKLREAMTLGSSTATDQPAFHGIAAVLDSQAEQVQLFPIVEGVWQQMTSISLAEARVDSASLEKLLRARLQAASPTGENVTENVLEHLALFARWYFSSWRQGEWLPIVVPDQVPYRRLLKIIGKLLRKQAAESPAAKPLSRMLV